MQRGFANWRTWPEPGFVWMVMCLLILPSGTALAQNAPTRSAQVSLDRPRGAPADSVTAKRFRIRQADLVAAPFLNGAKSASPRLSGAAPSVGPRQSSSFDVGDTLTFNVPRALSGAWETKHFTLAAEAEAVRLWVATDELTADSVDQTDIDGLLETILQRTPEESYDPERGIASIAGEVFGPTANYDGDGLIDVLWFDIFDDYSGPGTVFTPVIVSSDDIDPSASSGDGNQADMIYLDTYPTLNGPEQDIDVVRANLGGGYQALIHLNHDEEETTFVRIGLFEWMKVLLGFPGPSTRYAERPGEHNIDLLSYAGFIGDRERAALFMRYVADQLGVESTGVLTRSAEVGASGLIEMLSASADARTLPDLVADFHTANFIQDKSIDPRFGYEDSRLPSPIARPTVRVDASLNQGLAPGPVLMQPGGVQYIQWENVLDLELRVDAVVASNRERLRARAFVESATGGASVVDLDLQTSSQLIPGANDRVTLVLVHADVGAPPVSITVGAEWVGTAYTTTNVVYDNGEYHDGIANFVTLGQDWIQAVRFQPPAGTVLKKLFIPAIYQNQFIDPGTGLLYGSPNDPRDFTLTLSRDDGFGRPGDTLFQEVVIDPRPYGPFTSLDVSFVEIDMEGLSIGPLGESAIFVGLSEHGTDSNPLMLGLSTYAAEDVSLVFGPIGAQPAWFELWNLEIGGSSLSGYSIPVRAQFRANEPVGVASQSFDEEQLSIEAYPNPVKDVAHVVVQSELAARALQVQVVDVLGRRVKSLTLAASRNPLYEFEVDVSNLAAGLYFLHVFGSETSSNGQLHRTLPIVVAR